MGRAFEYRRASKEARWDKMSKVFPKLARSITMAVKDGGADPALNPKLRAAIATAKTENMPKDNIKKAIERAEGKDAANFQEVNYEGKGPHGVLIWVECATDNNTRTFSNVRTIFNKNDGQLLESGALGFMFNRKAVFQFPKGDHDLEEIELELIDAGLEELEVHEDTVYVYGEFEAFGSLSKKLDDLGIETTKANLQRIPSSPMEFSEEQIEEVEALIDKLDDDEDVQAVYTNIA
ncbi:YebC/PmpR family DNA-binding transcriptional regulator [Roseibacillus ishigakijimensis]|uniref:Probable transcriptional regulatory protein JIN78_03795 n=1 Tax=Roseibacillus ishigakijimensis TaxID=454146 RepID=A0A934RKN4_9BACT|nr:YebC/PmpR family DNA-binding transcriptional regulator [Roseibacillus ishigakijimensis]MBK1833174.1 YebC/PmpR family DNA-binding transcriptional regulator [Roseibacillus ishigakijimensis]